ncbi:sensor histidine kinase [Actinomadura macrotermitis]|uniref:Oxygen sensor histidine kinase NreB n=1 Tax=Actinomadura macrotermitis TaxID=2585200 RepID=A0A7K0C2R9_9ACTN|nr:hypothetical protein [Actinomadura macrotermitis]
MAQHADGIDTWERRERIGLAFVPYATLTISTVLALLVDHGSAGRDLAMVGLTAAAHGWIAWMVTLHPRWRERARLAACYYLVLLGLLGSLVALNPMYGFAVLTGYVHAFLLPRAWRIPGVVATAALAALSQVGGVHGLHTTSVPVYLLVFAVNAMIAGTFCFFGWRGDEESQRRKAVIGELGEANARLEAMMRENAELHARLLAQARAAGVHDERQRMAGEIHDTVAQGLAGVVAQLQAARRAHERGGDGSRHLALAEEMARGSLTEARRSVHALRPRQLEDAALPAALAEIAARWSEAHRIAAEVRTTGAARPMHPEVEGTLLRTAQEALANVAKHAAASRVTVTLAYRDDQVALDVRDDGAGFAPDRPRGGDESGGYGLAAMHRRVARVAGTLAVESAPGAGTAVRASVPAIPAGDLAPGP